MTSCSTVLLHTICLYICTSALALDANDSLVLNIEPNVTCEASPECLAKGLEHNTCRGGICVTDTLFPLSPADIAGSVGGFVATVLAAGSGLGGGGLLVPVYTLLMSLSSHEAVPLSKATIFGGAIASFLVNVRKRHPLVHSRPLIDYETVLLMEPLTLAGTIIGVHINTVFPEWLITICIVWLLAKTACRTYNKGKKVWKEEADVDRKVVADIVAYWRLLPYESNFRQFQVTARAYLKWKTYKSPDRAEFQLKIVTARSCREEHDSFSNSTDASTEDEEASSDGDENRPAMTWGLQDNRAVKFVSVREIAKARRAVPLADMGVLFLTWIGLVLFSMAKGGHDTPSVIGLSCGSAAYWLLTIASFPFFVSVTIYFGMKISRFHTMLQASDYTYAKGDMVWTKQAAIKYPALCTAAGIAAGLLGIGGGMVKGPLLIEMGLLPQVSSATSSSMILFTSSATTIQFIILGSLSVDHALWHGAIGFAAGLVGQLGMSYLVKKYRKSALVIFFVACFIGISGLVMGVLGVVRTSRIGFGGFRPLCLG
uniref:Sulfite exporter TauE/SafE n=1 Tax=Peronospora matthiolae TaxID=2874970 RepID=A0AAV1T6K8_9STRA